MTDDANAATVPGGDGWFDAKIELGARMGRYELKRVVGAGGMGVVFEARDPDLDRTVAVKVLRASAGGDGEARLRREGQIMARLTDANVIRVYDVGFSHGHAFVAMEFVAGGTLASWLEAAPRTPAEIIATFVRAGRGLAAAHDAGLVHRDFKPSNVLVGTDGRVLVTDFGIARPTSPDDVAVSPAAPVGGPVDDARRTLSMTRTGEVVGTPAYMAPEQYLSAAVDARADQFSFCVSLWRALYGTQPFQGTTLQELATTTVSGELTPPPAATAARVSSAIRAALERGLEREPAARFGSMPELLAVLEPPPRRTRAWWLGAAGGAVVVGAVAWAVVAARGGDDPCPAPDGELAAVWGPARKAALKQHLAAIDPGTGALRYDAAAAALDRAAPTWREMHVAACRATRVEGRQSDSLLDARMRCLDEWLGQLGLVVTGLETAADPGALEGAIKGLGALGPVDRCADLVALQAASQLPTAPAQHAEAVALLDEATAINAARRAGKREGLAARADALVARARTLDNPATLTRALAVRWRLAASGSDMPAAIGFLHELTEVAARGHDDEEAAYAWALMGRLTALTQGKAQEAKVMMTAARAAAARAGDAAPVKIEVLTDEADVLNAAGDEAGALADLAEARTLLEGLGAGQAGSPHAAKLAGLLQSLAYVHWFAERPAEAVAPLREAIAIFDRAYGPDTVESAAAYLDLAQVLRDNVQPAEAAVAVAEAIRIREQRMGESAALATALMIQADIVRMTGGAGAVAIAERGIAMARKTMAADDGELISLTIDLANQYGMAGRDADAVGVYAQALKAAEAAGMENTNVALCWINYADTEARLGRCDAAIPHFQKGGELGRKLEGEDSHLLGSALRGEGECLADRGDKARAIERLEASLRFAVPPSQRANAALARGVLGMLLADTGTDRARGLALVRTSLAEARATTDLGVEGDPRTKQLAAWLAKHPK